MVKRIIAGLMLAVVLGALLPGAALAAGPRIDVDQKSGDLVEKPKEFDGKEISFRGEAIGERMVRGDNAWIHLNDDSYEVRNVEEGAKLGGYNSGQAVWLPSRLTDGIRFYGDYRHEGDIVRVRGTFNAACSEHGGDMDIHATELTVVKVGHTVIDPIHPRKAIVAVVLAAIAALLFFLERSGWGPRYAASRPARGGRTG